MTRHAVIVTRLGVALLVLGGVLTIVGTLRPWVASGSKRRHSYDIVELVEQLGFARDGVIELGLQVWPLVPLLVVAAVAAAWWRRWYTAAVVGAVAAVYAGGVGIAVSRAPQVSVVRPLNGALTTVGGAVIVLVGSLCCALGGALSRRI